MAKPTKTAHARGGQIKPTPFTGDLKEAILAGLNARPGGVLGFLDKVALENPRLAGRGRVGTRIISRRRAWPALLPRARRNVTNEAAIPPPTVENGLPTAFQPPFQPRFQPTSNTLPSNPPYPPGVGSRLFGGFWPPWLLPPPRENGRSRRKPDIANRRWKSRPAAEFRSTATMFYCWRSLKHGALKRPTHRPRAENCPGLIRGVELLSSDNSTIIPLVGGILGWRSPWTPIPPRL
jgi:hypothetical protein